MVPTDIQHGPEVLQRFKAAHEPLVKSVSSFENMESHGEPIKPIFRQQITWTSPKEGITLLELFGGIGTSFKALLQSGMAVWKYFYVDIDPIARQNAGIENDGTHNQIFITVCNHHMPSMQYSILRSQFKV